MTADPRPLLLVVGQGTRTYREYALRAVARHFRVWLLSEHQPTWAAPCLAGHTAVDTADAGALLAAARAVGPQGVLTWDDLRVVQTAVVAAGLGLPGSTPEAALRCRDKHRTRTALAAAGVPQPVSTRVDTLAEARAAAAGIGYPLVLKPQALNASMGVVRVDAPAELAGRFRIARGAAIPGAAATEVPPGGVLVEEYVDGPEVSVDASWTAGEIGLAFLARKQTGYPPYFEEVGHLVDGHDPLAADAAVRAVTAGAHRAVGFHTGWTHTELRLTPTGPKVVEINARLGGDRIPELGELALGIDAARAAATLACGGRPDTACRHRRAAAIRFLYPAVDGIVRSVTVDRDRLPDTVHAVEVVALPGQELRLPPAGHVSGRYALVITVADTAERCRADLDLAAGAVHLDTLARRPAGR